MNPGQRSFASKSSLSAIPYAWLLVFFLVPFLIVLKISLSQTALAQPPYTPLLRSPGRLARHHGFLRRAVVRQLRPASAPIRSIFCPIVKSVEIAAFSTLLLLVIGYPIAYGIARTPRRVQAVLVTARHAAVLDRRS